MDSENLSETESTPFNCKNTASNTSPVSCVRCGSEDYMQAIPQAYYFTPLYPGIPKCKHVQGNFEEKVKFQQPFFSSPPLFHPFFHNIAIPPNFCWSQNYGNVAANKQQNQIGEHKNIQIPSNSCNSFSEEKTDFKSDDTAFDEDEKRNNIFTSELPLLGHCFNMSNLRESQISSFFQQFDNAIPWTCNPFITPIISYCLVWNSQKPNLSSSPTNYANTRPEDLNKKNNENSLSQEFSNNNNNNNNNNSKALRKTANAVGNTNYNLTEKKTCSQEEGLETDQQVESNDQNSGKSSTSLSLNSFNSFKHLEKEDHNRSADICAGEEGEDTEIERFDFEDQEESDEFLKSNKKNHSNKNSNVYLILDTNYNLNENESQSSFESSYTNLKVKKNSSNSEDVFSGKDISATREKCFNSFQDSDDESVRATPLNAVSDFKEQMASKKFIKNFTMTDQTNNVPLKEAQISVAAAGDLGGENCVGYKTAISSFKEDEDGKARYDTPTEENLESAGILLKGLRSLEEKKSDGFLEKSVNENLKNGQSVKSNIAKPSKLKDLKSDSIKNNKQQKECNQKDTGMMKRKHNCFPPDNSTIVVLDKSVKIQKTKNCTMIQQHFTGLEKQNKETNKIQTLKKEEKNLTAKVRPLSISQKTTKNVCKK